MVDINEVVARIVQQLAVIREARSLLEGVSGIDASGKGYIAKQIEARLGQHSIATASINADDWLNLPEKRFNMIKPGEHFYGNAIRFEELFAKLLLPLKEQRSANLVADCTEETARNYNKQTYSFKNVGVVLVEGIFLFKREHRRLFDLTIWVDCSFQTALARALGRAQERLSSAETIRAYQTSYFPAQKIHFERDNPGEAADLILDNDSFLIQAASSKHVTASFSVKNSVSL